MIMTGGSFKIVSNWAVLTLPFLNGGEMAAVVNSTILVLIPKVKNPQDLTQFRPISLCNVLYKICSKVIVNRLRSILDELISEE